MSTTADRVAALYAGARTDSAMLYAALRVEEVAALAYAAAAAGPLTGRERAQALRFAAHEREHAGALETMLQALTVPVGHHARARDVEALLPGFAGAGRPAALHALVALEEAAIAGHQLMGRRLAQLDPLRTVAAVMAGAAQHLVVLRDYLGDTSRVKTFESGR